MLDDVRNLWARSADGLPPGQGLARVFPRFGTHFTDPFPEVPPDPVIEVSGAVASALQIPLASLEVMPRREVVADFHCVAGWSLRGLRWEGVPFRTLWDEVILPHAEPGVTHVAFVGLDRYGSVLLLEDALGDDVLIADHLGGEPLGLEHGAPVRLLSPAQYGYKSTKHLARIELHTSEPPEASDASRLRAFGLALVAAHPRARVEYEERHRYLPAWSVRDFYKRVLLPIFATQMRPRDEPD